ncbi:TRAP transporter small permease [Pseudodonghicola sp.]|uniref:TRAP transporter small permease n=1 Tax=Pseudodonghicola sp. TaxID=1969463 RepID=UPI003A977156
MRPTLYDRLVTGLAAIGAASIGLVAAAIVLDVVLRNTGQRPFQSTSALTEYALLFSTMCAAPWLVRENGHIAIGAFTGMMPGAVRRVVSRIVTLLSAAITGVLSWRAAALTLEELATGRLDMRSISIPGWILYAMLAVGLFLMAVEFLRMTLRGDLYTGASGEH